MVSLLPTKFHEILFSNFSGVALTRVVYGHGQNHICGGATGSHVTGSDVSHMTGSDHIPEVYSAHAQPEVAQYPP